MKPLEFSTQNAVFGENQSNVERLPSWLLDNGQVISVWELTDEELKLIKKTKKVWLSQHTFNRTLQPVALSIEPLIIEELLKETQDDLNKES